MRSRLRLVCSSARVLQCLYRNLAIERTSRKNVRVGGVESRLEGPVGHDGELAQDLARVRVPGNGAIVLAAR